MFGSIGAPELIIIFAIALLVFGPKKLPEVGRSIGKALREFRKTSDEIKERIEDEIKADEFRDIKKDIDDIKDFKVDTSPEEKSPSEKTKKTEEKKSKEKKENEEGEKIS